MLFKKRNLVIYLMMLPGLSALAQTSYFGNTATNIEKIEKFKKTTTLFTLPYSGYKEIEKYNEAIKKVWTVTPFKIIKPEELATYQRSTDYSFFYLDSYREQIDTINNLNLVYGLKVISPSIKPDKMEEITLATITLFPDALTNLQMTFIEQSNTKRAARSKLLSLLYNQAVFFNWSPGFLSGYLKQINDGLLSNQTRGLDYSFYNTKRLPQLVNETLYVPEYVREVFSSQTAPSAQETPAEEQYRYKLKFVSNEILDSLILNKDSNIKYLVYTKRSSDKIISIYDSTDGLLIYQIFSFQSPNFSMSDLNNIKKTIKLIQ